MAGLLDKDIDPRFRIRDVSQTFTLARAEENPVTSLAKKGNKPKSTLYEWPFKVRHAPSDNAVPDGLDLQDSELVNNEANKAMIQGRTQKGRVAVGVSDMAEELGNEYATSGGLLADNVADGIVLARENMEVTVLKNSNSQSHIDNSNPMKLRGMTYFIRTSNVTDADLPIPALALTPAGNILTGQAAATDVTEEELLNILQSIATTMRKMRSVHLFASPALRRQISGWMKFAPTQGSDLLVRRFNNDVKSKEITLTVERITCDFGTFHIHTHFSLPSGVHGLILDMEMLELRPLRNPGVRPLEYRGGSHKRMIEYIFGLECSNPQAHGKITT